MPVVLDPTVGGISANTYPDLAYAKAYWATRPFSEGWDNAESQSASLVAATRMIDALLTPRKHLVREGVSNRFSSGRTYYLVRPYWTGFPATTTQARAWPRIGMRDRNGNEIPSNVIPNDLKDAVSELAGQMAKSDRLTDSDIATQGLTSVKAGSVALTFKDNVDILKVLPSVVYDLLVPSWMTDETIAPVPTAIFEVY